MIEELAYEALRTLPKRPIVHPNGFIQLYLNERRRLHVWPAAPMKTSEPMLNIHDHVYGFTSRILIGRLRNITYEAVEHSAGSNYLYSVLSYAATGTETPFERLDGRYKMKYLGCQTLAAGGSYRMEPFVLHDTVASGLTATLVEINDFDTSLRARVVCPVGQEPDAGFRRDAEDPEALWGIIQEAVARICGQEEA